MAIKADMTTHDGVALTQAYCHIPQAYVKKFDGEWTKKLDSDGKVVTDSDGKDVWEQAAATFKLVYDVLIYADADKRADMNEQTYRIKNRHVELRINADSGAIKFGADYDIELTHNADKGLILKHTATADDKPVILTLQTGETDIAANDVIGKIEFQAPDEGTGTDAILVAAGIQAVSEGDFSSSSNATKLEFMTGASEAAAEKMTLTSGGILNTTKLGVITDHDLGAGIHVRTADASVSAVNSAADELVLENSASCGLSIFSGTGEVGKIAFGDSGDNNIGEIYYNHNGNSMNFINNGSTAFTSNSSLYVEFKNAIGCNETAPDISTGGLCLNQGADDDNIITLKSSDVAHGITTQAETDTYAEFVKSSATLGGVSFNGYSEDDPGVTINGYIATETQTEITASHGGIHLNSGLKSGTDVGALNADGNIVVMRNNTGTQCIFKGDGEIFSNQTATVGTYDAFEDAQLVRAYDLSHGKGVINSQFDKFVQYNSQDLVDARLIGKDEDGNATGFANITGFMRLHNGAIWQQYEKHQKLANAVFELAKAAIGEEKANEILEENDIKLLN